MPIIIGFLLIILLIGFVASGKFGSLAQSKGYSSAKAKKYPWFIAGAALFCNFLGQTLLSFVEGQMMVLLFICWGCFVILAECAILRKAYKNMQVAPDKGRRTAAENEHSNQTT